MNTTTRRTTKPLQDSLENKVFQKLSAKVNSYIKKLTSERNYKKPDLSLSRENFSKMFDFVSENLKRDNYLKNVNILQTVPMEFKEELLNRETLSKMVNMDVYKTGKMTTKNDTWKKCERQCFRFWKMLVEKEVHSTAYMLRLIANSILGGYGGSISFVVDDSKSQNLTGVWEQDYQKINLLMTDETEKNKKKRTILGFGPSSSGKTYWAEQIIELFVNQDLTFPKIFLSVDGGKMREVSVVYQMILKQNEIKQIPGFLNLVSAGINLLNPSIFASDKIKKQLMKFLQFQSQQGNPPISLYVPETLGGCYFDCPDKYNKYIKLTGDYEGWIGLMIYQHLQNCPFPVGYQCVGTKPAGKNRQITQGKKYSASAYQNSFKNGRIHLQKSPFCRLEIHNSGGKDKSKTSIIEYPNAKGEYQIEESINRKDKTYQVRHVIQKY